MCRSRLFQCFTNVSWEWEEGGFGSRVGFVASMVQKWDEGVKAANLQETHLVAAREAKAGGGGA